VLALALSGPCAAISAPLPADSAATARAAVPDSLAGPAHITRIVADTVATRDTSGTAAARPVSWTMQPRFVMMRSLIVPGWGQFTNHSYVKAAAVAGIEGLLVAQLIRTRQDVDVSRDSANAAALRHDDAAYAVAAAGYNAGLDRLVGDQWLLGGVIVYALIDAYVDAHFRNFDIEFRTDPALPPGTPVDAPAGRRGGKPGGGGVRAALRWHY